MLYYLHMLQESFSPFRLFQYITVRAVAAAGTAFVMSILLGPSVVAFLKKLKVGQYVREEIHDMHEKKVGTPTMGGVLIIGSILISSLLWANLSNPLLWLVLGTLLYMGAVGFWDDFTQIQKKRSKGLSARRKLALQIIWAVVLVGLLRLLPESEGRFEDIMIPFSKYPIVGGAGFVFSFVWITLVVVGASNAVNLTDGLDGLAIGCSSSVALSYLALAYVAGHSVFASYLLVPYVRGAGELSVFCGAMVGSCLGFLWYNCHPAEVFMGDTGSLSLGGAIAVVALLIKQELLLVIVGGVFVMEAVSVIIQVASFKMTGRRVFAMAPLHHHFEKKNWSETQITVRFWILSIIFALLGILTLKIR
ncbi:MAG: phospho-N-acetylmuramoyl-pentapeptide-transferase [Kiritimatiellia bacterium]|nr:phospho-N-acetylmuramoyl-pentapeptide-transferase [Kiritimatiellia bacterium]MDP6847554.1 phospho-N-acetylmuramoyl-pentapeptide-transferase [Kiritimatiellia bacterium]